MLPQDFVVDEQDGIGAPEGMTGARLEVNVHVVTEPCRRRRTLLPASIAPACRWSTR